MSDPPYKLTEREQAFLDEYRTLAHAMQSGVAAEMGSDPKPTEPKHLRVGINCSKVEHAALVELLIRHGLIARDEYFEGLRDMMKREVEVYKKRLSERYGGKNIELH